MQTKNFRAEILKKIRRKSIKWIIKKVVSRVVVVSTLLAFTSLFIYRIHEEKNPESGMVIGVLMFVLGMLVLIWDCYRIKSSGEYLEAKIRWVKKERRNLEATADSEMDPEVQLLYLEDRAVCNKIIEETRSELKMIRSFKEKFSRASEAPG